jgi:hypothetical protein
VYGCMTTTRSRFSAAAADTGRGLALHHGKPMLLPMLFNSPEWLSGGATP